MDEFTRSRLSASVNGLVSCAAVSGFSVIEEDALIIETEVVVESDADKTLRSSGTLLLFVVDR